MIKSFRQFWPFYVSQHKNPINRNLHVGGTLLGVSLAIFLFLTGKWFLGIPLSLLIGYGCAWIGHFYFEKNRPATFQFPFYSLIGDFKLTYYLLTGKSLLPAEPKKVLFITGAGRGIGLALVRHFLAQGHSVFAAVRTPPLDLEEMQKKGNLNLHILKMDVTNEEQILQAVQAVSGVLKSEEFILINNAGISGGGPFELMNSQHWQEIFNVNVMGLVNVTRHFLPLLRRSHGRIINIGSITGRVASPLLSSYSSSKYAVRAISDSLRRELASFGISVVLIEPGPVATDIWDSSMSRSLKMLEQAPRETLQIYQKNIDKMEAEVLNIQSSTVSVEYLAAFVDEAVNAPHPKLYYRVGKRIGVIFLLTHFLPARILDRYLGIGKN
ncbi:MAG: SDR family NAD(P)-dependent oxidoreductase [Pseudobdellovibrionaceae bacterium]